MLPTCRCVQVVVAPLVRLTNKADATIDQVGTPEGVLESLGPFITGELSNLAHC